MDLLQSQTKQEEIESAMMMHAFTVMCYKRYAWADIKALREQLDSSGGD